jgi:possible membrane fusion protein
LSDGLVLTEGENPNVSEEAAAVSADEAEVVVN